VIHKNHRQQEHLEETGHRLEARSIHYKAGDKVSVLDWLEGRGLVWVMVSRERSLIKIEKWNLVRKVVNA
jgi:hypothetical protein